MIHISGNIPYLCFSGVALSASISSGDCAAACSDRGYSAVTVSQTSTSTPKNIYFCITNLSGSGHRGGMNIEGQDGCYASKTSTVPYYCLCDLSAYIWASATSGVSCVAACTSRDYQAVSTGPHAWSGRYTGLSMEICYALTDGILMPGWMLQGYSSDKCSTMTEDLQYRTSNEKQCLCKGEKANISCNFNPCHCPRRPKAAGHVIHSALSQRYDYISAHHSSILSFRFTSIPLQSVKGTTHKLRRSFLGKLPKKESQVSKRISNLDTLPHTTRLKI